MIATNTRMENNYVIYQLPIAVAFRVMNTLLLEGIPAFFRIALSLLLV